MAGGTESGAAVGTCRHCGGGSLVRNGYRLVKVPHVTAEVVVWRGVPLSRCVCRTCGHSGTLDGTDTSQRIAAFRRHLTGLVARSGVTAAAAWSGSDARSVARWLDATVAPALDQDLPDAVAVTAHGRILALCDAGTGRVLDALPRDGDALSERLSDRGAGVGEVRIDLDERLRRTVLDALPGARLSLLESRCRGRLSLFLADASRRGLPEAALLAERIRGQGWDTAGLEAFGAMARAHRLHAARAFLALWSAEAAESLSRARDGPGLDALLPRGASHERARAIVFRAGARGIRLDALRDRLADPSMETKP